MELIGGHVDVRDVAAEEHVLPLLEGAVQRLEDVALRRLVGRHHLDHDLRGADAPFGVARAHRQGVAAREQGEGDHDVARRIRREVDGQGLGRQVGLDAHEHIDGGVDVVPHRHLHRDDLVGGEGVAAVGLLDVHRGRQVALDEDLAAALRRGGTFGIRAGQRDDVLTLVQDIERRLGDVAGFVRAARGDLPVEVRAPHRDELVLGAVGIDARAGQVEGVAVVDARAGDRGEDPDHRFGVRRDLANLVGAARDEQRERPAHEQSREGAESPAGRHA